VSPRVPDPATAARMHATAAALTTAGLAAQVNQTQGVLDITASLSQPGGKAVEVIVDLCRVVDYADLCSLALGDCLAGWVFRVLARCMDRHSCWLCGWDSSAVGAGCSGRRRTMTGTRRKPGRLGPFVDGYRSWLVGLGYAPGSVTRVLTGLGHLGRWMECQDIVPGQLSRGRIEEFVQVWRAGGGGHGWGVRCLVPLLDYLREEEGIVAPVEPGGESVLEELVGRYHRWLVTGRALAPRTVARYEHLARRFLGQLVAPDGTVRAEHLCGADVTAFLLADCARLAEGSAKGRVAELRALLRFLYLQGMTPRFLAAAVPPVASWRDTTVPAGLAPGDAERLLASCDRSQLDGVRDFAILILLARLGLRSVEVSRLELGDVDWRAGEIVVRGKAQRQDRLPLPADVGQAIADYLAASPQRAGTRRLFLTLRAPRRPVCPGVAGEVVLRACRRAGLPPARAHRLRHGLATQMLRQGATLVEISQVLRHSDLATTAVYAKVDLARLRQVARPWPGSSR